MFRNKSQVSFKKVYEIKRKNIASQAVSLGTTKPSTYYPERTIPKGGNGQRLGFAVRCYMI